MNNDPGDRMKNGHGGARPNAGRTRGSGAYGEPTRTVRIPESAMTELHALLEQHRQQALLRRHSDTLFLPAQAAESARLPMYSHRVAAGFPSPADDHVEARLSLDEHLISHREATFFVRAIGNSMIQAGIFDGDLLVVDRSVTPVHGHIVIAVIDGELTVKRLHQRDGITMLKAENPRYRDILLKEEQELRIWGVVTATIKQLL